ncbi:MAG: response regulator transcription factor [Kofleriaceae bacterium]|nr:response regulator transcription factor [Kofleriaceae bacterium]
MTAVGEGRIRVLIADDHALLRAGLARLLLRHPTFEVVGESADGPGTLAAVTACKPDLLLLDLFMPETDPPRLIESVRAQVPTLRVLVITGNPHPTDVRAVLAAGASGVVLKDSGLDVLLDAIARVCEGRMFLDPDLPLDAPSPADDLSPREHEIMVHLARGASYRDIAQRFHLSERTVETYRRRIADKLGLRTRADLTNYALQRGLLATAS